jgi:hypothetical protein
VWQLTKQQNTLFFIKPISAPVRKPNPKVQALPTLLDSEGIDMSVMN